jgi:hypothetical protein
MTMIRAATLFFAVIALASFAIAADPAANTYVTAVDGVVCQECKAKLTFSIKKLPGVKEVAFAKGDKPGEQKITFASSATALEKKDIEKALGDSAKEFTVVSVQKVKP